MKKIHTLSFLIVLMLILPGCTNSDPMITERERISNQITNKTAEELRRNQGLILISTGGGMIDKIRLLSMGFELYRAADIAQARKILITASERYLSNINEDENIRPYLANIPFTDRNIKISIFFYESKTKQLPISALALVKLVNGSVVYLIHNPNGNNFITIYDETYSEALAKVQALE